MSIAGLDIGTTGCKITVYNHKGKCLAKAYKDYPIARSATEHEVNGKQIWEAVKEVISEVAKKVGEIRGIGVTSFGESFVLLDEEDQVICPSMLYTDPRGEAECNTLVKKLGLDEVTRITGLNPHSMFSLPKIMWIKQNQENNYVATKRIMLMEDFIVYRLSGIAQIDYSLASRTMAFDIKKLDWSPEMLSAADIDIQLLSKPVPSGTVAGAVTQLCADLLGLDNRPLIVSVGHDQIAAGIGAGVMESNVAVDGAGTVECITPIFGDIPDYSTLAKGNYAIVPYVIPGMYACYAFSYTGGALIKWYAENLLRYDQIGNYENTLSIFKELEIMVKDQPTGILVLPHFAGAATPYMDSGSKGSITGLTLSHNAADLYRAMMEGVVYEMYLNMEKLKEAGIIFDKMRATGGGANSKLWMQMKADILNIPITSLGSNEAGTTGCVMLTAIAVGIFGNLREAIEVFVSEQDSYYPRAEQHIEYMSIYKRYKELYSRIRPIV